MPRAAAGKKPKAAAGYTLSENVPEGTILRDIAKKEWKIGKPIGQGGFGMIYLVDVKSSKAVTSDAPYVLKIEPHSNGPLFCETHFYQRVAKTALIEKWMSEKKLKNLGVPKFIASGSHDLNGVKNRFMIMERFGSDLQKLFEQNGKKFPRKTVSQLAIKILNSLEYIHSQDYVHADIKAANLLLGLGTKGANEVYLVDYGLATKYTLDNKPRPYKEDPKKAHDGTVEFTSIDAHKGVAPSRRGDLEILGYCLLQWHCSRLPWEDNLTNKNYVRDQKIKYMDDIPSLISTCFPNSSHPEEIELYLTKVHKLAYNETPDYEAFRGVFTKTLTKLKCKLDEQFDFQTQVQPSRKRKSPTKPISSPPKRALKSSNIRSAEEPDEEDEKVNQSSRKRKSPTKPTSPPPKRALKTSNICDDEEPGEEDEKIDTKRKKSAVRKSPRKRVRKTNDTDNGDSDKGMSNGDVEIPRWVQHPRKTALKEKENQSVSDSSPCTKMKTKRGAVAKTRRKKIGVTVATQTTPGRLQGLKAMKKRPI